RGFLPSLVTGWRRPRSFRFRSLSEPASSAARWSSAKPVSLFLPSRNIPAPTCIQPRFPFPCSKSEPAHRGTVFTSISLRGNTRRCHCRRRRHHHHQQQQKKNQHRRRERQPVFIWGSPQERERAQCFTSLPLSLGCGFDSSRTEAGSPCLQLFFCH